MKDRKGTADSGTDATLNSGLGLRKHGEHCGIYADNNEHSTATYACLRDLRGESILATEYASFPNFLLALMRSASLDHTGALYGADLVPHCTEQPTSRIKELIRRDKLE